MTRRDGLDAPPWSSSAEHVRREEDAELRLAQRLVALHRSERAPRTVVRQVESFVRGRSEPRRSLRWTRRLEVLPMQVSGWPGAGMLALVLSVLVPWQHQRVESARRDAAKWQAEQNAKELGNSDVTASGLAVPGSLQWRMYGDELGMGYCEGSFLLAPADGSRAAPVRVHWTRCDLPDALSAELQRRFSPAAGAPLLPVSVRGHWARAQEFEALGMQLQP
jgi:hypothetical protein